VALVGSRRGSVTLEGGAALLLVAFVLVAQAEICRRVQRMVLVARGACLCARSMALGGSGKGCDAELARLVGKGGTQASNGLRAKSREGAAGLDVTVTWRYPALVAFPWKGGSKHHMEVSETCRFPY